MTRIRSRTLATLLATALAGFCGPSGGGNTTSEQLAGDQTLRFAISSDVATLDPGRVESGVDITFASEIFNGLLGFDNELRLRPVIAASMPDVSPDGKIYTFRLRRDVRFSNGDKVTSRDVLYSWNRANKLDDTYATVFDPIVGAIDASGKRAKVDITGLTAPDDYTVKAQLTDPAGFWLTEVALWTAAVVNQKAVAAGGEDFWWAKPETAIGTGPFKMTKRTSTNFMEFKPVDGWWGGSTGALTRIAVDISVDEYSQVKRFEAGSYDLVGMANNSPAAEDILRFRGDSSKKDLIHTYPAARTTWVGFNFVNGPFASRPGTKAGDPNASIANDPGKAGRHAFATGIDRDQLVDAVCAKGATCSKAAGGPIAKGLKGYLGDGADPNSKFDSAGARSEYQRWDPDGKRVSGLTYRYNTSSLNKKIAENLQAQWKQNLNISVGLDGTDYASLIADHKAKKAHIFRGTWLADYDHPQDWYDNLWECPAAAIGRGNAEGYCNPALDQLVASANRKSVDKSEADYKQAGKMMTDDVVDAYLIYSTQTYFTQSYVRGAGFNSMYDFGWEGIRLLKR
jgi:oligopeptide transport system substrate-binding protein